jgi:hypothetical protein
MSATAISPLLAGTSVAGWAAVMWLVIVPIVEQINYAGGDSVTSSPCFRRGLLGDGGFWG